MLSSVAKAAKHSRCSKTDFLTKSRKSAEPKGYAFMQDFPRNAVPSGNYPRGRRLHRGTSGQIPAVTPFSLFIFIVILYLFGIQLYYIIDNTAGSSLLDEVLAVLFLPFAFASAIKIKQSQKVLLFYTLYFIVCMAGLLVYKYTGVDQPLAGIIDMFSDFKIVIFYTAFILIIGSSRDALQAIKVLSFLVILLAILNSVFVIKDSITGVSIFGNYLEERLGFFQPRGLQSHKIRSVELSFLGAIFSIYFYLIKRNSVFLALSIYLCIIFLLHVSAKETAAFLFLIFFARRKLLVDGSVSGFGAFRLLISCGLFFMLVFLTPLGDVILDRFGLFYGEAADQTARGAIATESLNVARDHFPFGAGAGMYASSPSVQMGYSELYYRYGLWLIDGASPDNFVFVQDNTWPKFLGESGFIGCTLFVCMIVVILHPILKLYRNRGFEIAMPFVSVAVLTLFVSTGSAPFSDDFLGFLLATYAACAWVILYKQPQRIAPPQGIRK